MISPLVICEAMNDPLTTQLFSGSEKANAAATRVTVAIAGRTISLLFSSGVRIHIGTRPIGPVAAPTMAPTKFAFDVSRSRCR